MLDIIDYYYFVADVFATYPKQTEDIAQTLHWRVGKLLSQLKYR